jgi:hypothetical protein
MTAGLLWDSLPIKSQPGDSSSNDETGAPLEHVRHPQDVPTTGEGQDDDIIKEYNQHKKTKDDRHADEYAAQSDDDQYQPTDDRKDLVESLIILVMCMLLGWLVYIRQLQRHQGNNLGAGGNGEGAGRNAGEGGVYGIPNGGAGMNNE